MQYLTKGEECIRIKALPLGKQAGGSPLQIPSAEQVLVAIPTRWYPGRQL